MATPTYMAVSSGTDPSLLAAAITNAVLDRKDIALRCLGAAPVNQAVKAAAIACSMLAEHSEPGIVLRPEFRTMPSKRPGEGNLSVMFLHVLQEEEA